MWHLKHLVILNYVAYSSPAQLNNNASGSSQGSASNVIAAEKLKAAQCEVDIDANVVTDSLLPCQQS